MSVVTGSFETAGTTATVSLYVYGENKVWGPLVLGSGNHRQFGPKSTDSFKVRLLFNKEKERKKQNVQIPNRCTAR